MTKTLTYIEIDVELCANVYGVAPCTASVGVTGERKCFNTVKTCQDVPNYNDTGVTLRFAMNTAYLPAEIPAIPILLGVDFTPQVVSLGKDLGERAILKAHFDDHPHPDTGAGFDPYVSERDYNPYKLGTLWGKFRARRPYLRGRALRWIDGELGQDLADMTTRHFIIESFDGPRPDGTFTIVAQDVLKLADGDRAQFPTPTEGILSSDLTAVATSCSLLPTGIGDAQYPLAGNINIGGNELCGFTRVADALTLVRGILGTTAVAHDSGDRVQNTAYFNAQDAAAIVYDLFVAAGVDPTYLPLGDWLVETENYLQTLYTAAICEPTSIKKMLAEIIEQAGLVVWWDDIAAKVRLQVLRPIQAIDRLYDESLVLDRSLNIEEQPDTRLSQVLVYYGQRNPMLQLDEVTNYQNIVWRIDEEIEELYGSPAIKTIFSRWIPTFGLLVAQRLSALILGRFRDPPRRFVFGLFRNQSPVLGAVYNVGSWAIQDETGAPATVPIQITRLRPPGAQYAIEAEEVSFHIYEDSGGLDLSNRTIIISSDVENINVRAIHDSLYPVITDPTGITLTVIVQSGVVVGSTSIANPALDIGSFVAALDIIVQNNGRIQGRAGNGGAGVYGGNGSPGQVGGPALYTRYPITLENNGEIFGGGGGGGGAAHVGLPATVGGGGGGAGTEPGNGGAASIIVGSHAGSPGTPDAGGPGGADTYPGGAGGNPGLAGAPGTTGGGGVVAGTGGLPGAAIDGVSDVTVTVAGDRRGPEIN